MANVEFEGKDLEEAIAKAASALNMPPEKVKFSVISMGTKGFLGLGRRKARIAVDPDDPALVIEDDRPDDRKKKDAPKPKPAPALNEPGGQRSRERKKTPVPTEKKAEGPRPDSGPQRDSRKPEENAPAPKAAKDRRPEKKDRAKDRPVPAKEIQPLDWSHLAPALTKPGRDETLVEGTVDQTGELALGVTKEILTRMGFEAEIKAARINSRIVLSLESADNALLIGARGGTLEALQLLVSKIVTRRLAENGPAPETDCRVVLDVADYRARRRELLLDNLRNLSEQVRQTRKPQTMPGLNSDERRLIQLALRPFKDLHIISSGGREALTISPHPPRPRRKAPGGQS